MALSLANFRVATKYSRVSKVVEDRLDRGTGLERQPIRNFMYWSARRVEVRSGGRL